MPYFLTSAIHCLHTNDLLVAILALHEEFIGLGHWHQAILGLIDERVRALRVSVRVANVAFKALFKKYNYKLQFLS